MFFNSLTPLFLYSFPLWLLPQDFDLEFFSLSTIVSTLRPASEIQAFTITIQLSRLFHLHLQWPMSCSYFIKSDSFPTKFNGNLNFLYVSRWAKQYNHLTLIQFSNHPWRPKWWQSSWNFPKFVEYHDQICILL